MLPRTKAKLGFYVNLGAALCIVLFTIVLAQRPRAAATMLPQIPIAILWSMFPTLLLGVHVFRLESRVAMLEVELDTKQRIKEALAAKNEAG